MAEFEGSVRLSTYSCSKRKVLVRVLVSLDIKIGSWGHIGTVRVLSVSSSLHMSLLSIIPHFV